RTRFALDDAVVSLRTLADEVDRGAVATVDGLDRALARTDLTLVMFFTAAAREEWTRGETIRAGRALDIATTELEQVAARTGQFLEDATAAAIGRARWFAGRLMQGAGTASEDFHEAY